MSQPKRGLGRGLGALLGDSAVPTAPAAIGEGLRQVPVDRIRPNPHQPRKMFDQASLDELKQSIAEYGILVPIIVREREGGYELVAGERRWRACAALQRPTIPAIVRRSDDRESLEVAIIENLQRENLNPLEEAAGFASLIDEYNFTQEQVAQRLGKGRPSVTNALRLLTLPEVIKAMLVDGRLSAGHAKALLGAPDHQRVALAERAIRDQLTVRDVERLVSGEASGRAKGARNTREASVHDGEFEAQLRMRLGAAVQLKRSGKGGKIEIRFTDEDELIRVADVLLGTQ
ncbi:MAG: ParB/RepB/Spo0J family partition protein [Candidatus Eremiobacteraeota bacterium]|nr:ParB/RepB/Spo0J family partition protein [Candidatus Eremiobacteraeota bacterium]